ncbi:hypothetical protein IV79_GL000714 [Pediococcus claussenii]|nr:hypothetical protein IV79_GL000714 [Pediococcus claussenii]
MTDTSQKLINTNTRKITLEWTYHRILNERYKVTPLRTLLKENWWLTKKQIHFLRINHNVLVNGNYVPINNLVRPGDRIELKFDSQTIDTPIPPFLADDSVKLDIIFEMNDFLVVNKPAGYKTHSNQPGELNSIMNFLTSYLDPVIPYNVHRLDQATSGALLVAKNPVVLPILNQQISKKIIKRSYLALVEGGLTQTSGTIDFPIGIDPKDQRKRKIGGPHSLSAITHYQVLSSTNNRSLVQLDLETGRTHQIRLHLAAIGHPIIGDPLYSNIKSEHMLLHSWKIKVPIPFTLDCIQLSAGLPQYFKSHIK